MSENNTTEQEEQPTILQKVDVRGGLEERRMGLWHTLETEFSESREIRDRKLLAIKEKLDAQREMISIQIAAALDVGKKLAFQEYLKEVTAIEHDFMGQIKNLDRQHDEFEEEAREECYEFFDRAREKIIKWEGNPERYQAELKRIEDQEQKRLAGVQKRLRQIEVKREDIFDQTLKIFRPDDSVDDVGKKFKII